MKFPMFPALTLCALLAGAPAAAGDAAAGEARARGACSSCHGMDGTGLNPRWPNLGGQNDQYLIKQLKAFREEIRKDSYMTPMTRPLTDEDIRNLAAYYSAARPSSAVPQQHPAGSPEKAAICVECHGAQGVSANPEWPNLAGQKMDYLIKQMRKFRDGIREDPLMSPVAKTLSNQEINELAAYYAKLRP
ncbi:MAG: cytochrome c [Rhodocyclaceae bacterium]|jgi:cytochrome c553|nr:cytochrome c [Rhodocyclaceae bacterium]MCL4757035.1 cytochrome c [Rhodocyclaceae bacterium]